MKCQLGLLKNKLKKKNIKGRESVEEREMKRVESKEGRKQEGKVQT